MFDSKDNSLSSRFEKEKYIKLILALGIDLFGMLSYLIPGLSEISDVLSAPFSALLVFLLFGRKLKWASFTFLEELKYPLLIFYLQLPLLGTQSMLRMR